MTRASSSEWWRSGHLVGLTAIGLTCAPTTLPPYTIGLFVAPLQADFGWSRTAIQAAILFSTGSGIVAAPLAGALVRRFGIRRTILPGLIGLSAGLGCAAAVQNALWQFYLAYMAMSLLGAGAGGVAWNALLTRRFDRSRGLALGIGLSGTGLCSILMPQVAGWAIGTFGWRGAYLVLGLFAVAIVLPLCALMLPREAENGGGVVAATTGIGAGRAWRLPRFWVLGLSTAAIYLAIGGAIPNLVPLLTDTGLSASRAADVMSLFGVSIIVGRIGVGALVDRLWAPGVAFIVLLVAAAGCLILALSSGFIPAAAAAMLIGLAAGTELDLLGFLVARYFGLADFARIYGRLFVFVALAAGTAPLIFAAVRDLGGSYRLPFLAAAGLLAVGAAMLLCLGPYPREADAA